MILSEHEPLICVGIGDYIQGLGGFHTAWTQMALHIYLSARDMLRMISTLSLFMSTLSVDIAPNRREHQSLNKIILSTEDLGKCMIPITPRVYSKERY